MAKFRNLNVDFRDVMKLSMRDRLDMLQDYQGQGILAGLTPAQLVDLFPRYYSEKLPSVGKNLSGIMSSPVKVAEGKASGKTFATPSTDTSTPSTGTTTRPSVTSGGPVREGRQTPRVVQPDVPVQPSWQKKLQEKTGIEISAGESSGTAEQKTFDLIRRREGFISTPKYDVNALRVGYGSDTITKEDGTVVKVTAGMRVTREDAERDLRRRIPEFQRKGIINYIGEDAWNKLNSDTKAAITSLAYNYGSIAKLESLKKALVQNNKEAIAAAVESYASHNNGINRGRRNEEASIIRRSINDIQPAQATDVTVPQNLDPKFIEEFNKFGPERKRKIIDAIGKLGDGNTETGVQKFNELYRANPSSVSEIASRPNSGASLVEMRNQSAVRNLPITASLNDQLNYAATQAGVKVEVFSGGQERPFMVKGKMTSTRHNAGGAADVKLYVTDEKGNKRYLDMRNPEDAAIMKKFTASAVHAGATGVGAGPGYMGHGSIHIGGGKTASWGGASWVGEALNEGLARRQSQPLNLEDWKKQQQEKRELPNNVTQASPEIERKERENTYERVFGVPPQKKAEGTQKPQVTQPTVPAQPSNASRQQEVAPPPEPATQGRPTTLPAEATSPNPRELVIPGPGNEDVPVQPFALGGETQAQGPLTAYAIDKDRMRRDDTLVTDGRVKFTMNSEKESMKYNPDTGRVQIDQARGETRQKINPNELGPEARIETPTPEPQPQQQQQMPQVIPQQVSQGREQNSFDTTTSLVDNIFKSASFKRAVAQSRFMKDSDPLGGHYDFGAYNIT